MKKVVVKRGGGKEKYDEKKVYASVYASALNCEYGEQESEKIAKTIMKKISAWAKKHSVIDSNDIREQVLKNLKDRAVKLMYKHHLDLS